MRPLAFQANDPGPNPGGRTNENLVSVFSDLVGCVVGRSHASNSLL